MTEWDDALRAAYHEGFGGTFTRKKASEHMADAFGHLARAVLRAVDAAYAYPKKGDPTGMREAALFALKSEVFNDWLRENLAPAEYTAIQARAAAVQEARRLDALARQEAAR